MKSQTANKKFFLWFAFFAAIYIFTFSGCIAPDAIIENNPEITAFNLMKDTTAQKVDTVEPDSGFYSAAADFSIKLFKETLSESGNTIISPVSALLALAMAANGADGDTLSQMENVLGGGITIDVLNKYLYSFVKSLPGGPKEKLGISNSIWFREKRFDPYKDFLQANADYYGADAYAAPFDSQTVRDINTWINKATDGLIKKMLEDIPEDAVMYLINTILFDAEWAHNYEEGSVRKGVFSGYNKQNRSADFMHSSENRYITGKGVKGFIKPYYGSHYSFAAILPDEGIDILKYAMELTGCEFFQLIVNARNEQITTAIPKFNYVYEVIMNDALKAMGMEDAFSDFRANFLRMGSSRGNLFISLVKHKANITVNERGTQAGAATVIEVSDRSFLPGPEVILNRPFIFAIIDNSSNIPLFIGAVLSVN